MKEQDKGVTLIALIITIIVLLILAGVAFSSLLGSNGLLNRAVEAGEKSKQAANNEEIALQELDNEIAYWSNRGGTEEPEEPILYLFNGVDQGNWEQSRVNVV